MQDIYNSVVLKRGLSPVSSSSDSGLTTEIIDMQGYHSALLGILTGSIGDADVTFAVTVAESDNSNMSSSSAVASANIVGGSLTDAGFRYDDDNEVRKLLIRPTKRYIQATITPTGNSSSPSAALLAAFWQLIGAQYQPTTQPAA